MVLDYASRIRERQNLPAVQIEEVSERGPLKVGMGVRQI